MTKQVFEQGDSEAFFAASTAMASAAGQFLASSGQMVNPDQESCAGLFLELCEFLQTTSTGHATKHEI